MKKDVNLIVNEWEEYWKSQEEKTGPSKEEEEQEKSDEK
jgi:hypothetical protein